MAAPPLAELVVAGDRSMLANWFSSRTVAEINTAVASLSNSHRILLVDAIVDTNAIGEQRSRLTSAMLSIVDVPALGFLAEVWTYTTLNLSGDGFYGNCGHVWLSPDALASLSEADFRAVLVHESFHSFSCLNAGPEGALNEGAAIWLAKVGLTGTELRPGESFAEATYGTKLYYRDLWNPSQPDYPLLAPSVPSPKLLEVLQWLSAHDPSGLPWSSQDQLSACYTAYWESLDRDVDFFAVWLPAVATATQQMRADPACTPYP